MSKPKQRRAPHHRASSYPRPGDNYEKYPLPKMGYGDGPYSTPSLFRESAGCYKTHQYWENCKNKRQIGELKAMHDHLRKSLNKSTQYKRSAFASGDFYTTRDIPKW